MSEDPGPSGFDPAAALESLREPGGYPPGFFGTMRDRLPLFALAGAFSILLGLIPFPHRHEAEVLVAGSLFFALLLTAIVLPWRRLPVWVWPIIPIGFIVVIALIGDAQGGAGSGVVALYALPIVWLAFYGRRWFVVAGLVAVALALVVPIVVEGAGDPADAWREALITMVVLTLVAFIIMAMAARDRAVATDLAEQSLLAHQSARQATEAREQLASLLRAATDTAIIGSDGNGLVTFFSAGAEQMLGWSAAEAVGHLNVLDFADAEEMLARADELAQRAAQTPGMESLLPPPERVVPLPPATSWTYVRRDGARRRATISVTRAGTDEAVHDSRWVIVATDVTEREQLAAERERLLAVQHEVTEVLAEHNHRLRELTQMKDDLVATVSHELRTPLTSIRGFAELLLEDAARNLDPDQIRMLRTIDRNSLQLLHVSEDLLADPGGRNRLRLHFVDTDLAQLTREAVEAMAAQAATRHARLGLTAPDPVVIHGDPARLHQLLANLLSNALKFTAVGGRVEIEVDTFGQFARLEVHDDGPGIPPTERDQLFERFYRLASSTEEGIPGSGLGLAIAKSVAEAHDGSVDVVDVDGWSTTFRVLLPLPVAEPAVPLTVPRTRPASTPA